MKVLFIGGTGNISTSVSKLAIKQGIELYLLNRGQRKVDIPGAQVITGDINMPDAVNTALDGLTFDAVVNWIAFVTEDIELSNIFSNSDGKQIHVFRANLEDGTTESLPDKSFRMFSDDEIRGIRLHDYVKFVFERIYSES